MQTIFFMIVITLISAWALWDCYPISPNLVSAPTTTRLLSNSTLLSWPLVTTLLLISNGLMLLLKTHLHSYPITLITLTLLVLCLQDLVTSYVNIIFAWGLLGLLIYHQLPNLTIYQLNTLGCLSLILLICINFEILGSGDLPIILMLHLGLPALTFSYLLILAASLTAGWLLIARRRAVPFVPSLSTAFWSLLVLDFI
ncbi:hypothetical protein KAR53_01025 [Periweissella ghanensis]|uniref:Prepilin type IV endopeptidase peptidase domain-containing protein n=1 Tax=Periweissella ghanensis TaxID=467997 RepID=A0ABM8ZCB5_9LACO|nr:hypothetical protein [Periweissella ghanensis]MCM0600157.1 hypothetical protein [Periweissella ghanensis]CAH0419045.1 hypothetical protein WGH24286_01492 [Periweissella ghanensis]